MPITRSVTHQRAVGDEWEISGVFDIGSYVTGGVPFQSRDFGYTTLRDIQHPAIVLNTASANDPVWFAIDWGAKKIMAFNRLGTEITAATSLSGCWMHYTSRGII